MKAGRVIVGIAFVVLAFASVDIMNFAGFGIAADGVMAQVVMYLFTAIGGYFIIRGLFGGR